MTARTAPSHAHFFDNLGELEKEIDSLSPDIQTYVDIDAARAQAFFAAAKSIEEALQHERPTPQISDASLASGRWKISDAASFDAIYLTQSTKFAQGLPLVVWRANKPRAAKPWVLQAPHRFYDKDTGSIALQIFATDDRRNADVLMLNTKHRYAQRDGQKEDRTDNPSDVCHHQAHPFLRTTELFWQANEQRRLVQLHGFGARQLESGAALAIISSGNRLGTSTIATTLANSLRQTFGPQILLFPKDTQELGATTNVQGHMLQGYAKDAFLHLELSAALRKRLLENPDELVAFRTALFDALAL